jgi:glycosidase
MKRTVGFILLTLLLLSCNNRYQPKEYVELKHPEWCKNATIYEVNIRQYTKEGTFKAFTSHLPRLKKMGIDIIWLMPIHPIGELHRKGKLGSYYSVRDFTAVNPEFGTKADFKALVDTIHALGMHVIIDWVGNHSAWDNPLAKQHPDWYTHNEDGGLQPTPWYDWDDVIDFDYDNPAFRKYMTGALKYWVKEFDIDGYRCDVAGFIPVDFWENAREELDAIKPVFMLAEWESRDLFKKSFDMTYSWTLWDKMIAITRDKKPIWPLIEYFAHDVGMLSPNAIRMLFVDNHDKNSWEGNPISNFGPALELAMVTTVVVNGMPLVYTGQETGLNRSLSFFDKDSINWNFNHPYAAFYTTLFELKHRNQALWNGAWGGPMIRVVNDHPDKVISFTRTKGEDKVLSFLNYSDQNVNATIQVKSSAGKYRELFSGKLYDLKGTATFELKPWGYLVLEKVKQ